MENTRNSIGEKIRHLRNGLSFTQAEVAEKAAIPFRTYQDIEYGKRMPRAETLGKIASALGVSIDFLIGSENANSVSESDLILSIIRDVPTLNQNELRTVRGLIDAALSRRSPSDSSAV